MRLKDRVSIVTGAASGVGRATALLFGREGSKVVVVDIAKEAGEETVSLLRAQGSEGTFVETDVSSDEAVQRMVEKTIAQHGKIDILINNAAYLRVFPLLEMPIDLWDHTFNVNIRGYFLTCRHIIPHMVAAGGGAIVNVGSITSLRGARGVAAYGATKASVAHLTRSLCVSYRAKNIRVNCIVAGGIATPMAANAYAEAARWAEAHPDEPPLLARATGQDAVRAGQPEEYAAVALFLVSDDASYVNGAALVVDGGSSA